MQAQFNKNWKTKFFSIWIGQAFSLLGSQVVQFTLIWFLTEKTGSAAVLATSSFVSYLPNIFLAPFIGALIDRWDRKRIMIVADTMIALVTLGLILLFRSGLIKIWHIWAAMFLREIGSTFHWPSMRASTSLLVPEKHISRVEGMNQLVRGLLNIAGPLLATLLLQLFAIQQILAVDIITAAIAVAPLFFVFIPKPKAGESEDIQNTSKLITDVKMGIGYLWNWRGLLIMALTASLLNFVIVPAFTIAPLLVTQYFMGGVLELSLIETLFGIGVIGGGLIMSTWGGFKKRILTTASAITGMGVAIFLIAIAPSNNFNIALAGIFLTGIMNTMANASITTIMQTNVLPKMQGRVFTTLNSLTSAMMPISLLLTAPVSNMVGIRGWYYIGGIGCTLLGLFCFLNKHVMTIEEEGKRRKEELISMDR